MLILTRCVDESVIIGDETTVSVLEIKGSQIRPGIYAPRPGEKAWCGWIPSFG
jgi:carbon storage regulator